MASYARKLVNKATRAVMKSHRVSLPNYHDHDAHLPLRLRPWFLFFTFLVMLLLAVLSFTNVFSLNDKFLHLTCFGIATAVFYFIFDVDEDARRIWFWRHANLIFTAVVCFFFGGFVSEIVQSILPYKHFDLGDVLANVVGSAIGLYTSYYIEKHYRSRREIARLYRPLNTDDAFPEDYSDDEAGPSGTQLLPLFNSRSTTPSAKPSLPSKIPKADRLADVWDEREELFGVGDDSESDSDDTPTAATPSHPLQPGPLPTITISRS